MKSIKISRKIFAPVLALFFALSTPFGYAEKFESPAKEFSIQPSEEWMELPLPFQGVVVSYGKKGTLATFHIAVRDLDAGQTIDQLEWKDLFSPQFESIDIRTQNATFVAGEKAKFCIYTLKPGEFKQTMEGKLPAKYINYVLVHQDRLFSITFKDTENGFALTYPSFLAAIRTLQFNAPDPISRRKTV